MVDEVSMKTEKGMAFKTTISIGALFGLIGSYLWFMHSKGLITWFNLDDAGFQCVLWLLFWTVMCIIGIKKESIAALGMAIMAIWNDKGTTSEQKLALIMQQVQQWLGWIADISQLLSVKVKEEVKLPEAIVKPVEQVITKIVEKATNSFTK
jgi:apolipoprotein N-acyltransferase